MLQHICVSCGCDSYGAAENKQQVLGQTEFSSLLQIRLNDSRRLYQNSPHFHLMLWGITRRLNKKSSKGFTFTSSFEAL